jgi:hypothetical protein
MKLDLLTNATVIDDAIRFVSSHKSIENDKLKSSPSDSNESDREESNEPGYNEDQELEEKQEEQTGEITATTNQVF